jgi:hypothetical protein
VLGRRPHYFALAAGAADESAGAADAELAVLALSGDFAGSEPPPHAARAPTDAMAARRATIAMFFMIVFSSEVPSEVEDAASYASGAREPSITRLRETRGRSPRARDLAARGDFGLTSKRARMSK